MIAILDDEEIWGEKEQAIARQVYENEDIVWVRDEKELYNLPDLKILILDLELGERNGIEVGRDFHDKWPDTTIIITTNYDEYLRQGYEIDAYRYVSKNNLNELKNALYSLKEKENLIDKKVLIHIIGQADVYIKVNDIFYIETYGRNLKVHWKGEEVICKGNINEYQEMLNNIFVMIHRSIIVNMQKIQMIKKGRVLLKNGSTLDMPINRRKSVIDKWLDYKYSE